MFVLATANYLLLHTTCHVTQEVSIHVTTVLCGICVVCVEGLYIQCTAQLLHEVQSLKWYSGPLAGGGDIHTLQTNSLTVEGEYECSERHRKGNCRIVVQ